MITPTAATEDWIRDYIDMPPITEEEREQIAADERDTEPPDMDAEGPTDEEMLEKVRQFTELMKADENADPDTVERLVKIYDDMVKVNETRHDELGIAYSDWGGDSPKRESKE